MVFNVGWNVTFQRARNEEQREIRRKAILETAEAMLAEMPLPEVGLNELSRRVGLAKSNVLRYFDSREAVLLELLDEFLGRWMAELQTDLAAGVDKGTTAGVRAGQLADVIARSLSRQPVLCHLFAAQGAVLERNVSTEVAKRHKRASLLRLETLTVLIGQYMPELGERAQRFCLTLLISAGALSTFVPPPPSVLAAYAEEPELGALSVELEEALQTAIGDMLLGMVPRD